MSFQAWHACCTFATVRSRARGIHPREAEQANVGRTRCGTSQPCLRRESTTHKDQIRSVLSRCVSLTIIRLAQGCVLESDLASALGKRVLETVAPAVRTPRTSMICTGSDACASTDMRARSGSAAAAASATIAAGIAVAAAAVGGLVIRARGIELQDERSKEQLESASGIRVDDRSCCLGTNVDELLTISRQRDQRLGRDEMEILHVDADLRCSLDHDPSPRLL
jgi:hypothetical protein